MQKDNSKELVQLINQIPEIKAEFREEYHNFGRAVGKPTIPMKFMTIRKSLKFRRWRAELEYQFQFMPENAYIKNIRNQFQILDSGYTEEVAFNKIEAMLLTIKSHINDFTSKSHQKNTDIYQEEVLCNYILKALVNVQKNPIYRGKLEDEINDGIRDNLSMIYPILDQTRQGESESGLSAGEIDLLILDSQGLPYALIEALRLPALDKENLSKHIDKALYKYDPIGCPYSFIFTYVKTEDFQAFWDKFIKYLCDYQFAYEIEKPLIEVIHGFAESRHARVILNRNGILVSVHFYAIHIRD